MSQCKFDWSICTTCASQGNNLCPLENNRTIKRIKTKIQELETKIRDLEERSARY